MKTKKKKKPIRDRTLTPVTFTAEEYADFCQLVRLGESREQMMRIESRIRFPKFIEEHGERKCDAMFAKLKKEKPRRGT